MPKPPPRKGRNFSREPKEFEEEVIQIDRVTRVVKGGRRLRFRATVVIGNRNQKIGYGIGKSNEVTGAIQKAIEQAKKNIIRVPIYKSTVPHDVRTKYKSSRIILMPACEGTGIIAGGPLRKILELAGVKNVLSKIIGTKNKLINTQAAFQALGMLKQRSEQRRAEQSTANVVSGAPSPKTEQKAKIEAQAQKPKAATQKTDTKPQDVNKKLAEKPKVETSKL
jgi:small subunit ribosomal protein S5